MSSTETPADPATTRPFDDVSAVVPAGDGVFTATVDGEWTIGGKPNGGYLLAMLGRAGVALTPHDHVIAASAHYVRSPDPGPVEIVGEVLRAGRSASQVRTTLHQGDQRCVEALLTVAHLEEGTEPYWADGLPEVGAAVFEEAIPLSGPSPSGIRVPIMEQVSIRIDQVSTGFLTGTPSGSGELRGWLSLPGDAPFDPFALLFAVDAFPPATFEIEMSGWVPTLELTAYVRALPAPGPVRVLQKAQLIDAQRVDEACFVWDSTGRLVAQCTQLAGIRLG